MRIIKFRGKHDLTDEWKYGNLECTEDGEHAVIRTYEREVYRVHPDTVGQFTGLHDIDGNEIYEGDILEDESTNCHAAICYNVLQAQFVQYSKPNYFAMLTSSEIRIFRDKVIGNIHDNPELLSETK